MDKIKVYVEDDSPSAELYLGDAAREMLAKCLNCAFADDATGGVFGYRWEASGDSPFNQTLGPKLTQLTSPEIDETQYFMVIVDSGNTHGDSWKYIFHIGAQSGTFIQEA